MMMSLLWLHIKTKQWRYCKLNVDVIYVGNTKESYLLEAQQEYLKRLGAYFKMTMTELKETKLPDNPSQNEISKALNEEGERILQALPKKSYNIALCIEGKQYSSVEFSEFFEKAAGLGHSRICFIIGGPFGMAESVKEKCDVKLSLSKMTFTHRMAKILLLEQIYRAGNILSGGSYHK